MHRGASILHRALLERGGYRCAQAYALRLQLEEEASHRYEALTQSLNLEDEGYAQTEALTKSLAFDAGKRSLQR